ncbi:50S ribosomal protein L16 [Candidatus Woesearchaeota archaeon]|nr:50S ribosomal protein L16 [Candidatus Woesearchaeota archaeon]
MAKLRKFVAYRRQERPYTRISKFRKKAYVKARPNSKIVRFDMGNLKKDFPVKVHLISKEDVQIRHNAFESARLASNRLMEKNVGKINFNIKIRVYPHHILRENPLASGAGADRMSTGMKLSFGKTIGVAAQVDKEQKIMTIGVAKEHIELAKKALTRSYQKLPCSCRIEVEA